MKVVEYELLKEEKDTKARLGILKTPHGNFSTPMFMPVGTKANVKTLMVDEVEEICEGMILANTYHLWTQPENDIILQAGGVHKFMNWKKGLLTDSGGFQVFSLSKLNDIKEEGVYFKHHKNGSKLFMSPEISIETQNILGSDIMMSFDECPPFNESYEYLKNSVERTIRWAKRGYDANKNKHTQSLFGIVQGGPYKDLRKYCLDELEKLDFEGYSIGGLSVGETKDEMYEVLRYLKTIMPKHKPRYLMGVGTPEDILEGVINGVDMFDCVLPSRNARHGSLFTKDGQIQIKNAKYKNDFSKLTTDCNCKICKTYTKAYINHLMKENEILGMRFLTYHNIYFLTNLMNEIKDAIKKDELLKYKDEFLRRYLKNKKEN